MNLLSWFFRTPPDPIDSLIKPPKQKYHGHDETRHSKSMARRERADALRAEARRVELKEVEQLWYRRYVGRRG